MTGRQFTYVVVVIAMTICQFPRFLSAQGAPSDPLPLIAETLFLEPPRCLEPNANALVTIRTGVTPPGASVRVYFRRLSAVGSLYYVEAIARSSDELWAVLPQPSSAEQEGLDDAWWDTLATRDWMQIRGRDRSWLEEWLGEQTHEAAEMMAAVFDVDGSLIERSEQHLVEVRGSGCRTELTTVEIGESQNIQLGETSVRQNGHKPYHWQCDGLLNRVNVEGIIEADLCRGCVGEQSAGADS